jgi:hypothetical protein
MERHAVNRTWTSCRSLGWVALLWLSLAAPDLRASAPAATATATRDAATVIVVVGAPGESEFGESFEQWAALWKRVGEQAGARVHMLGGASDTRTNESAHLQQLLAGEPRDVPQELWLVLIGHGTFDGKDARFNLRGPDVTATELAVWLQPFHRPVAVLNTASSSAPFLNALSASNRVILTATRSGHEQNYARFGQYLAEAIAAPESDLDKDNQTSLLEAFLMASRRVADFYKTEGRLATEHPLIEDNGDGRGTPADWFRGVRAIKKAKDNALPDGTRAHQFHLVRSAEDRQLSPDQRTQRNALEQSLARLREKKPELPEAEYYRQIETLVLELARICEGTGSAGSK